MRFAHSSVFEQLFTQILASCRDAGLLDGSRLIVDATHVEADAALKSLRAELEVIDGDGFDGVGEPRPARPDLALAAPRSGPTPKRKASNATAVSRTDPDAKLRYKPGHRPHLVYRAQVATDPKTRVIVAVNAERATGHEADSLPQPNMLKRAGGQAARTRCKTPRGVGAAIDRITHGEGAIAELKRHGAGRARCRGTAKLQIQLLHATRAHGRSHRDFYDRLLGELDRVRALQEAVLHPRQRVLGADHPETLASMDNLVETMWQLGEDVATGALLERVTLARRSAATTTEYVMLE